MDFHSSIPTTKSCGFQMIEALHTFCACEFDVLNPVHLVVATIFGSKCNMS
jgi:hypothetical protein